MGNACCQATCRFPLFILWEASEKVFVPLRVASLQHFNRKTSFHRACWTEEIRRGLGFVELAVFVARCAKPLIEVCCDPLALPLGRVTHRTLLGRIQSGFQPQT